MKEGPGVGWGCCTEGYIVSDEWLEQQSADFAEIRQDMKEGPGVGWGCCTEGYVVFDEWLEQQSADFADI